MWVKGKLWIWNKIKDNLRNAQGEIERKERDRGNEKEGEVEKRDFC